MNRIRPEEMISVRNRRYPSGIDRIRSLKPLTFVIDVMNVDGGDERLTAHPDAPIQNGSSSFRWQNETRSNLPNLADIENENERRDLFHIYIFARTPPLQKIQQPRQQQI